eukprot:Gb_00580 [translate_table: standard]
MSICANCDALRISGEMLPEIRLFSNLIRVRFGAAHKPFGKVPSNSLFCKLSLTRLRHLPKESGIGPEK